MADDEVGRVTKLARSRVHEAQAAQKQTERDEAQARTADGVKQRQVRSAVWDDSGVRCSYVQVEFARKAKQEASKATASAVSKLTEASNTVEAANEGGAEAAQLEMEEQLEGVKMKQAAKEAKKMETTKDRLLQESQDAEMAQEVLLTEC